MARARLENPEAGNEWGVTRAHRGGGSIPENAPLRIELFGELPELFGPSQNQKRKRTRSGDPGVLGVHVTLVAGAG
ncbi:MAG: hypothetical protein CMM47_04695, partial [Rhodospirillaceae bacterium]|nr:hypothetical protein [Rhodospirillaceae bacterium]